MASHPTTLEAREFSPELMAAWSPRTVKVPGCSRPVVDVRHSCELVTALRGEIERMGFSGDVAALAAGSFVNCQGEAHFGLLGTHNPNTILAAEALRALKAWAVQSAAQPQKKAA